MIGYRLIYGVVRPALFRMPPQQAHERTLRALAWLDDHRWTDFLLKLARRALVEQPTRVGGVDLPHPLMLAAGLVKGEGFSDEADALAATSRNLIPGWRSLPLMVGAVEFGSYTRYPRLGNAGTVIWRDEKTRSTQNRVGLKDPGATATATFLAQHHAELPPIFGINLAVSPGVSDPAQVCGEVLEALAMFLDRGVRPAWFTLNLSCPNTEDDPGSHQTEREARDLCGAMTGMLGETPLWVKISPDLADEQYRALVQAFADTGVRAVIATNTLPVPAPDGTTAGIGGGRLQSAALEAVTMLNAEKDRLGANLDIIGCGGVMDGKSFRAFQACGAAAVQYWSALVYRGPLAAALIEREARS